MGRGWKQIITPSELENRTGQDREKENKTKQWKD